MPVNGHYLAKRWRLTSAAYIRAYEEWVMGEMLPTFNNLESRADEAANAEFDRLGTKVVSEDCDGGWAADKAHEKGLAFYETMDALRQTTLNLFAAGLFHLLEQQLADLCHDGALVDERVQPPNDTNIKLVAGWYCRYFHLDLQTRSAWRQVDELRLVTNAVKHGEGDSAKALRQQRPDLFENPTLAKLLPAGQDREQRIRSPLAGEDLYITERLFREYSEAINQLVDEIAAHFENHGDEMYPVALAHEGNAVR